MNKVLTFAATFIALLLVSDPVFAEAGAEAAEKVIPGSNAHIYFAASVIAAGFGIAAATWLTSLGQGNAIAKAVEGIARQPEAAAKIQTVLIIGLAFIESLVIYALLISLILLFLNPFKAYFIG